jgi:hypothetical protein
MNVKSKYWRRIPSSLLVVGALAAVASGDPAGPSGVDPRVDAASQSPECETHATLAALPAASPEVLTRMLLALRERGLESEFTAAMLARYGLAAGAVGVATTASGQQTLVWRSPEYHDCQDLLEMGDTVRYRTRAGIKATGLTAVLEDADFARNQSLGWNLAWVQRLSGPDYPDLLMDRNELCLYVGLSGGTGWWAAALDCGGASVDLNSVPRSRMMQLTRLDYGKRYGFLDYPPVARWEWDREKRTQAYGVKCGSAWCVMRAPWNEPPRIDMTEYGPDNVPQNVIAGWRDEQMLADTTLLTPGNGRVATLWAALIPNRGFSSYTEAELRGARVLVGWADVRVRGNVLRYRRKYGFETPGRYEIYLVRLDSIEVVRNNRVVARRNITYNSGLGAPIIGAMRWAWSLHDEEQWIPCPFGCCETRE